MDSCQIFNFLFGTRKATTELSKCFSSMSGASNAKNSAVGGGTSRNVTNDPPLSPLKQIQVRLANLTSKKTTSSTLPTPKARAETVKEAPKEICCEINECGTYRATLVQSLDADDDETDLKKCHQNEVNSIEIVPNPSFGFTATDQDLSSHSRFDLMQSKSSQNESQTPKNSNELLNDLDLNQTSDHVYNDPQQQQRLEQLQTGKKIKCKRIVLYGESESDQDLIGQQHQNLTSAKVRNTATDLSNAPANRQDVGFLPDRRGPIEDEDDRVMNTSGDRWVSGEAARDKRNAYVRSLVQSIESNKSFESLPETITIQSTTILNQDLRPHYTMNLDSNNNTAHNTTIKNSFSGYTKPVTFVKPMPPKLPPKTIKAKCLNLQINLNKPVKIQQLFQDEEFLVKFFNHLDPLDRCTAAQVCRSWRNILYADKNYWKDLILVIDCTQMRREQLVDCILSTLQNAKLNKINKQSTIDRDLSLRCSRGTGSLRCSSSRTTLSNDSTADWSTQQQQNPPQNVQPNSFNYDANSINDTGYITSKCTDSLLSEIDQDDVWRIQELCNKFTQRSLQHPPRQPANQSESADNCIGSSVLSQQQQHPLPTDQQQQQQHQQITMNSKSSSIPSQISSTLSSYSLSSLLSPLSASGRIETMKEKLYNSLDERGFEALCLFGATNEDIDDIIAKVPISSRLRITVARFNNCCISNRGLELFIGAFNSLEELELSGCNELTNTFELTPLNSLKRLIVTDCINIADGIAQKIIQVIERLSELTIQAYHLTDAFLEYLVLNSNTSNLRKLELPNCKELTNQSLVTVAKYLSQLETLSISGSTKISDDGIEVLVERARQLKVLDLSWCSRITDASLECIACDLGDTLTELILDRNVHITDNGLSYLATMNKLTLLHIRWCSRITDIGLESIIGSITSLKYLSLAGLHQITARSLLCLVETCLLELEMTNCPAVNNELSKFLSAKMPNCNIVY